VGLAACIVPSGRAHDTLPGAAGAGPARRARARTHTNTTVHRRFSTRVLHFTYRDDDRIGCVSVDNVRWKPRHRTSPGGDETAVPSCFSCGITNISRAWITHQAQLRRSSRCRSC